MSMTNSNVDAYKDMVIEGYAVIFNSVSRMTPNGYREKIMPTAFDGVDISDVKCLVDHDWGQLIGRTKSGTLEINVDEKGLKFKCYLPNTSTGRDIYENIKLGNIDECSFFYTLPQKNEGSRHWETQDRDYVHVVHQVSELREISIVTMPAYDDTSVIVAQRSEDLTHIKELEQMKIALDIESLRFDT